MRHQLEREAKFVLPDGATLPALDVSPHLRVSATRLSATCWDTLDLRLLTVGHTLRHRSSSDGTEVGWTLKLAPGAGDAERSGGAGLMIRREIHVDGTPDLVPDTILALVRGVTRGEALVPVAMIVTDRRRVVLTDTDGNPLVEIADDTVSATPTGGTETGFREIEVEQLDDDSASLVGEVIDRLKEAGARREHRNKLQVVLGTEPSPAHARAHARKVATVGELVRESIARGTNQLISNDPHVRLGDDPAALHRARVATRRLRSDLRSLRHVLDRDRVDRLRGELAWLGQLLGGVRDLDVLRAGLLTGDEQDPTTAHGITEILAAIDRDRRSRQSELVDALDCPRYLTLLAGLAAAADSPPFADGIDIDERADELAADIVRAAWRSTARAAKRLGPHPSSAELHDVRKLIKRARYASELAAQVHGRRARRFAARLATVQVRLGIVHDADTAREWFRRAVELRELSGTGAFVAGQLAERERRRARTASAAWRAEWRAAAKAKRRSWLEP